jgi:phosphonoacetate hydrolase
MSHIVVNGRAYRVPETPTVVICIDGVDPAYVEDAFARELTPRLRELAEHGAYAVGHSQIPSFTNPNNLSIVTGAPPVVHGLPGNHYLDRDGREVQLTDPLMLRAPSIHAVLAAAGVPVLAVTTKDKLRRLLAAGDVPCFSAEKAGEQAFEGAPVARLIDRPTPGIYAWDCSHYALELALALQARVGARLTYVSLTDAVQHAEAPGGADSDRYLARLDELVGELLDRGLRVALVADHGVRPKTRGNGSPDVIHLDDVMAAAGVRGARTILPITDPYVRHHAALGSACWVHVSEGERDTAWEAIARAPGVEEVTTGPAAAARFGLPADRIGDLFVLAGEHSVLGTSRADHDLSELRGPLRSHGGRHESRVPILISEPLSPAGAALLEAGASNADVHHLILNEVR